MTDAPLVYEWSGEGWIPLPRFRKRCDESFAIGERATLEKHEERSMNSHRHFFAEVKNLWETLPEDMGDRFPNPEALRGWALIKSGYCDVTTYVASTKAEAQRVLKWTPTDDFTIVTVKDCVVTKYTAKSQAVRAMDKNEFQASKEGVLRVIGELLGVADLEKKAA